MNDKELMWEEVETTHLIQNEWIDFRESEWRFPDGLELGPFYTYHRKDYAVIAALDETGRFLCVRQFRQGIRHVTTEFPAGGLEEGEDPLFAAKRELREETGYVSDDWKHLLTIPANATISDNYVSIFVARNCCKSGEQHLDETEMLSVVTHTAEEIDYMIHSGKFQQAVHVMAWLMAKEAER